MVICGPSRQIRAGPVWFEARGCKMKASNHSEPALISQLGPQITIKPE